MRRLRSTLRASLATLLVATGAAGVLTLSATPAAAARHDNQVYAFGSATFYGSTEGKAVSGKVVAMASNASGSGYWLVTDTGAVYAFNARYYGGLTQYKLGAPIVGITATPTGGGYWLVGSDGYVYRFGDAPWHGHMAGKPLNSPIKSLISTKSEKGYYLYAADGGVFTFGKAKFYGSTGNKRLNAPVVGMATTPKSDGYWLVAKDGGIFTFGKAKFKGSTGNKRLNEPVIGMAPTKSGNGYWLGAADGGVFSFGDAGFKGSAAGLVPNTHSVVQLVAQPQGGGYRMLSLYDARPDIAQQGLGASGAQVRELQSRLFNLGYYLPGASGTFDSLTQQAVYAFQKYQNLPRTGVVDAPTQIAFRTAERPRPLARTGYVVEIDKAKQIMYISTNGHANWVFNVSSGNDRPFNGESGPTIAHTPTGFFTVIRQINAGVNAPLGYLYRPKYFTWSGIAVHGSNSVPPFPASHGCIRVTNTAMNYIWVANLIPMGTTVWVY
jgi:lipoprotein-anchoring transpeptidase ErfK/SrfK